MEALTERKRHKDILDEYTLILIQKAEHYAKTHLKRASSKPGKGQFSSLVEVGQQATCIEQLELFIRYKEFKQGTSKQWTGLAKPLVDSVEEVRVLVAPALELALVQRFLGYLMWAANVYGGVR